MLDPEELKRLDALPLVEADTAIQEAVEVRKAEMSELRAYRAKRVAQRLAELVDDGEGGSRRRKPSEVARELGVHQAVVGKLRDDHLARQDRALLSRCSRQCRTWVGRGLGLAAAGGGADGK